MTVIISKCKKYRYWLERDTGIPIKNACVFIMLNPSTADAELDDPTIRRCRGFAERFQCGKLVVVNLFAYRATKPADLYKAKDPVGPENDKYISKALQMPGVLIGGWGANDTRDRVTKLMELAAWRRVAICCLGKTKSGAPKHPLYLPALALLEVL